jgi:hypothetical protein
MSSGEIRTITLMERVQGIGIGLLYLDGKDAWRVIVKTR